MNWILFTNFEVDTYKNLSGGVPDGKSWHEGLANNCSVTECTDKATELDLFKLGDYLKVAEHLKDREATVKRVSGACGVNVGKALLKKSADVRAALAITRAEMLLLRTFQPDAVAALGGASKLDGPVRALKTNVVRHAKWNSLFDPIYARAQDALAGK